MDAATLENARRALQDHAWTDAFEGLSSIAADDGLAGEDYERLADAAWWTAHPAESVEALERAYAVYMAAGNRRRAAYVALELARQYNSQLQSAIGKGWFGRGVRLLENEPESVEHGYLHLAFARSTYHRGELAETTEHASAVLDVGTRYGDNDLQAYGLMYQGCSLIGNGDVERGLALVDEAAVAAVGGELTPYTTGIIYCMTIVVCRDLADYRRAGEWTDAAKRWCERQAIGGFPGVCRVHRAEIMRLRGSLKEAEEDARRAAEELMAFGALSMAGEGFYEIGEVRLRMGDLDAAEEAFEQAHQHGVDPQPGLALLHMARQRTAEARSALSSALAEQRDPLKRARLLPAQVEITLGDHDVATAREAVEELSQIAATYGAPVLHAAAHQALGAVLTHEDDASGAVAELRRAVHHWSDADLPFETARARRWLARAYRAVGDEASAVMELRTAASVFRGMGAVLEAERCEDALRSGPAQDVGRRTVRTFVFTDIVGSTNLLEALGDEAWRDIRRWHDDTLRTIIEEHDGEVVQTTGDGFFAAFDRISTAISAAVAIQRSLAEHRRLHGFAPQVRIGMHSAEATSIADDYAGLGVHEAARVGAAASAGEILATCDSIAGDSIALPLTHERSIELKGLTRPVRVVGIDWRDRASP